MSHGIKRRVRNLERHAQPEREVIARNRQVVASMVESYARHSGRPPAEARRFFLRCLAPELSAHLAEDWETNPLPLEALRLLNQPDGHLLLYERTLESMAQAYGLEADELLLLFLLDARHTLESQLLLLRLAHRRKLPFVLVNLHGPDVIAAVEEREQAAALLNKENE